MHNMFAVVTKCFKENRWSVALVVICAFALVTSIARAATSPDMDPVAEVRYEVNKLTIKGDAGLFYVARTAAPPSPCAAAAQTLATLERWQALATAALLSGKELRITYCVSNPGPSEELWITGLDLLK